MRRIVKLVGKALFFLVVALLLAPALVSPFLDRIYYRGPATDHFDGARFSNPVGAAAAGVVKAGWGVSRLVHYITGKGQQQWPARVPVTPSRPLIRVCDADGRMRVTWIGHATVLVQTRCLNILTDPIWSERTGPFFLGARRVRAPGVRFNDLPRIDLVLLSHNHYDHFDLPTLQRLWTRDRPLIVTGLGNDALLAANGIEAQARDWGGRVAVRPGVEVIVDRVHHWSTRWYKDRNRALWSGFTVTLPGGNLFFAGDTGLGDGRWPDEAARHGPIRLAILPIGSFKPRAAMQGNHIDPEEAVDVFGRLGAAYALGVHWGTFQLSAERIDEAPRLLRATLRKRGIDAARFRATEAGETWEVR